MINANGYQKHFQVYLSTFVIVATFIYIFCITFLNIPKPNEPHVNTVLGFLLGTAVGTIISYYLGSSKGSADKTGVLNKEVKEE